MTTFTDRPDGYASSDPDIIEALIATQQNGKAVSIPLNGQEPTRVRARYASALRRQGFALRCRREGKRLVAWVGAIERTRAGR